MDVYYGEVPGKSLWKKIKFNMTNKYYICDTGNPGHDGLSHCLTKVNRASNPIDFYREPEHTQICPLFL